MVRWGAVAGVLVYAVAVCSAQTGGGTTPNAQLHEAVAVAQRGDINRAYALTDQLLQQHPEFEPALKFEGALLEQMGRGADSAAAFEHALQLAPNDPELMFKVGVYQLVAGDKNQAIALFVHRLKLVPQDADTLFYLAQAYHLKGDNDLALKTIRECQRVDPTNIDVWQKYGELLCSSGDNEGALKWLLKAQQADPKLDRIDYDLSVASFRSMDLAGALQYATKAAELRPNDLSVLELLSSVQVKLAMWQDAEPVFKKILAVRGDDVPSMLGLGHTELELKNYQQAADVLEKLIQQDPTQVLAHFYLSRAYQRLGRTADAQHEADLHSKMLEQVSSAPSGNEELEKATWKQARQLLTDQQEPAALQLFRDRSNGPYATPGNPYVLVGVLYLNMERPDDATRCFNEALKLEPNVRGAHTYLGIMAMQQGDLDKADSELTAELAHDPNYQAAVTELGEVRYRRKRFADAAELLSRSRTMVPSLLYMLCDSYFQVGKTKDADLTAELILDYSKNDPAVMQGTIDLLKRNQQTDLAQRFEAKLHP